MVPVGWSSQAPALLLGTSRVQQVHLRNTVPLSIKPSPSPPLMLMPWLADTLGSAHGEHEDARRLLVAFFLFSIL